MRYASIVVLILVFGLAAACGSSTSRGPQQGPTPDQLPQTGTVSVDLMSGDVTVVGTPALTISGVGTYDDMADELTIDLEVLNSAFPRLLFNLKMLLSNLNEGSFAGDGTFDGTPFAYFGPEALAPGAMAMRSITLTGITGAMDPITFDMEWLNHRMVFHPGTWDEHRTSDIAGTGMGTDLSTESTGFGGVAYDSHWNRGVISPDGRYVYLGNHNQPCLTMLDTTTLVATNTLDLTGSDDIQTDSTGSIGHVRDVKLSSDGSTIYCVYTEGDHTAAWGGNGITEHPTGAEAESVFLVRIDRATLTETGRATLVTASTASARGHSMAMNAAGTRACVTVSGEAQVWLVDLTTMTPIDTDAGTMGVQPFDVSSVSLAPQHCAMNAAGTQIHVAFRGNGNVGDGMGGGIDLSAMHPNDGTLAVIDVATGTLTTLVPDVLVAGNRPAFVHWAPDGRLFYGRKTDTSLRVDAWDPATMMWTEILTGTQRPYSMGFYDGKYLINENQEVFHVFDLATDTYVPSPAAGTDTRPTSGMNGFGESLVISPF